MCHNLNQNCNAVTKDGNQFWKICQVGANLELFVLMAQKAKSYLVKIVFTIAILSILDWLIMNYGHILCVRKKVLLRNSKCRHVYQTIGQ